MQTESVPRLLSGEGLALPGVRLELAIPNPAAGAEWSAVVPAGTIWRPLMLRSVFTCSAAVANRNPRLQVSTADRVLLTIPTNQNYPAGSVATIGGLYNAGGQLLSASGLSVMLPLPDVLLQQGYVLGSQTSGIDVADQYSAIVLTVDQIETTNQLLTDEYIERRRRHEAHEAIETAAELHELGVLPIAAPGR